MRSIRYANEIEGLKSIIANDMDETAYKSIERNIRYNKKENLIIANHSDAVDLMYQNRNKNNFDVIDLDPYGSPSIFTGN